MLITIAVVVIDPQIGDCVAVALVRGFCVPVKGFCEICLKGRKRDENGTKEGRKSKERMWEKKKEKETETEKKEKQKRKRKEKEREKEREKKKKEKWKDSKREKRKGQTHTLVRAISFIVAIPQHVLGPVVPIGVLFNVGKHLKGFG